MELSNKSSHSSSYSQTHSGAGRESYPFIVIFLLSLFSLVAERVSLFFFTSSWWFPSANAFLSYGTSGSQDRKGLLLSRFLSLIHICPASQYIYMMYIYLSLYRWAERNCTVNAEGVSMQHTKSSSGQFIWRHLCQGRGDDQAPPALDRQKRCKTKYNFKRNVR